MTPKRNRSAEALTKGRRLVAFEIGQDTDALINEVAVALTARRDLATQGRCTRLQALEWLIREGAKKLLKKLPRRVDLD